MNIDFQNINLTILESKQTILVAFCYRKAGQYVFKTSYYYLQNEKMNAATTSKYVFAESE